MRTGEDIRAKRVLTAGGKTFIKTRLIASLWNSSSYIWLILISSCLPFPKDTSSSIRTTLPKHFLIQYSEPIKDTFDIMSPTIKVPTEEAGYTLICPEEDVLGLVVTFHAGRDTSHPGFEQRLAFDALKRNVATMYVTTGHRFDFLFDSTRYDLLDRYIKEVIDKYKIPMDRILFTGMSLAGTRALKMALWYHQGHAKHEIKPTAVAICDAPLDFVRFWKAQNHAIVNNTHPTSVSEASWTNYLLENNLGGTPYSAYENYVAYSPYVKMDSVDPKISVLKNIPIRIYTEPDLDWWMENRNRDAYGINSMDASALVGDLRLLGNKKAMHITSQDKGYRPDGTRHPHSWSIVDNAELIQWFILGD